MPGSRLPEDLDRILHDLRGPLNAIAMHAEVVKRAVAADAVASASVRTIQQELERLADLLAATMSIVALEGTEFRRVDLRAVVCQALDDARVKDVVVTPGPWPHVVGDAALLARAVVHLAQNAVEATDAAGGASLRPEISAEPEGADQVALVVRDHGIGLRSTNPKILIRLRSTTKPGHAGVGLVTTERIARLHGGALRFGSPGVGAVVMLLLPRA